MPQQNEELQKITTQALIHEISMAQITEVSSFVPWFLKTMPASYFRQIPEALKKQHIKTLGALCQLDQVDLTMKIDTKGADGSIESTFICKEPRTGLLNEQIKQLKVPPNSILSRVKVYTSLDNQWALNIFSFESRQHSPLTQNVDETRHNASKIFDYIAKIKNQSAAPRQGHVPDAVYREDLHSDAAMMSYLSLCKPSYSSNSEPRRFLCQREMYEKVRGTDGTVVTIEPSFGGDPGAAWITIASANVQPQLALQLSSEVLKTRNLDIQRAHLDTVSDPENSTPELPGFVTMLRMLIAPNELLSAQALAAEQPSDGIKSLMNDLKRSKWIDDQTVTFGLVKHPQLGLNKAEIITALSAFLHGPLHKLNSSAYGSVSAILDMISSSPHFVLLADGIASLFLDRFNPKNPLDEAAYTARDDELRKKIARLQFEQVRVLLLKMLDSVQHTQKTNFYHSDRYALGIRFNPNCMRGNGGIGIDPKKPIPFGIIFVHGRDFYAFHNRFRDIARGGLRVVTSLTDAQHAMESSRCYDEAYGLSYAQQLKNKDIPEGGSKAVVLVNTAKGSRGKADSAEDSAARFILARKSIRAFTDSLLDLTVTESCGRLVDLYRKDELIYLGPDEQVIPSDIDWITLRAAQRGYPIPSAFMSSKPGAGFNHKQYGVTSEGVVCYLETALNASLGINPREQPFTIKITGGPDGDVAGNLIKILFREFPTTCKILGVSDGTGVCEDPQGLDASELLRLVSLSQPIIKFDSAKLSPKGVCLSIETDEGLSRRNSMVFRIKSDSFIPAGGRPNTINSDNWRQFLDEAGKPTSPLIVEGANIFTTPEAREALFNHGGVAIVKDSSANKCGVITSSCEVSASMLLSTAEFLENKDALVNDVLVRIRHLARLEAELLFREFRNYPGALPHFSERISNAINTATDALTLRLADVNPGDPLWDELLPLVGENLPKKLRELAWDRVLAGRLPVQYTRNAIASTLASKLVYAEGIHLVETQPLDRLADRMIQYYREDSKLSRLIEEMDRDGLQKLPAEKKELVKTLLRKGGTRASLNIF